MVHCQFMCVVKVVWTHGFDVSNTNPGKWRGYSIQLSSDVVEKAGCTWNRHPSLPNVMLLVCRYWITRAFTSRSIFQHTKTRNTSGNHGTNGTRLNVTPLQWSIWVKTVCFTYSLHSFLVSAPVDCYTVSQRTGVCLSPGLYGFVAWIHIGYSCYLCFRSYITSLSGHLDNFCFN